MKFQFSTQWKWPCTVDDDSISGETKQNGLARSIKFPTTCWEARYFALLLSQTSKTNGKWFNGFWFFFCCMCLWMRALISLHQTQVERKNDGMPKNGLRWQLAQLRCVMWWRELLLIVFRIRDRRGSGEIETICVGTFLALFENHYSKAKRKVSSRVNLTCYRERKKQIFSDNDGMASGLQSIGGGGVVPITFTHNRIMPNVCHFPYFWSISQSCKYCSPLEIT